ncbi:HLA class I histocompatibility antigen, alpha chain G-like, partial [Phyllostomus hastatus]|uniref:HLA class I histocompatibility antigen, alpha chain G-like n=1 Tax=Phyllostomus hastatus TaxID=9423 RepID=UPI001E6845BD
MAPRTLLLLSGTLALTQTWEGPTANPGHASSPPPGPHSLTHFHTAVHGPGSEGYRYTVVGYVDDSEILGFDSNTPRPRLQARVPWMEQPWKEQEDTRFWEEQTRIIKLNQHTSRENLNRLRARLQPERGRASHLAGNDRLRRALETGASCDLRSWTAAAGVSWSNVVRVPDADVRRVFLEDTCVHRLPPVPGEGEGRPCSEQ